MNQRYCLKPTLVAESFDDGALLLDTATRRGTLINLNHSAYQVVLLTDGRHSVAQIAQALAAQYDVTESQAQADVQAFYDHLAANSLIELVDPTLAKDHVVMSDTTRYIRNPDVGLREESEDGALLFEPDSGQVKVINPTGLFIWTLCDGSHTVEDMIQAIQNEYDDVPLDVVTEDVQNFVSMMFDTGFLGVVEPKQRE